jgi:hypothetical protein
LSGNARKSEDFGIGRHVFFKREPGQGAVMPRKRDADKAKAAAAADPLQRKLFFGTSVSGK